jgi:hypothetical protein
MHHKRKRPKNRRAGCLMCKPHKMNGARGGNKTKVKGIKGKIDLKAL